MRKPALPVYTINTLNTAKPSPKDFIADRFAHYLDEHPDLHFPHKHSFYHFVYFSKGSGRHSIDFIHFPVKTGEMYFMRPGQVHGWEFKSKPDGYIINFSEQYLGGLIADSRYVDQFVFFNGNARDGVISIPAKEQGKIECMLESIAKEGESSHVFRDDYIRATLVQLFITVNSWYKTEGKTQSKFNNLLLHNFQQLIELHYKEKRLTKDYAALLYITPNHLNALSKEATGRAAGELIRERVLLEAKRLLSNVSLNISEISGELEFTDNSYFSKFFKKYEGVTPEEFRIRYAGNKPQVNKKKNS